VLCVRLRPPSSPLVPYTTLFRSRGTVAMCWPYKNEYDPRYLARKLRDRGAKTALPVVVAPRTPLLFREWHPGVKLVPGVYDIPRSEEHTSELQSRENLVCRLLLE